MDIVNRFLKYVSFDTQSSEESTTTPSTAKQMDFANYLFKELKGIGLEDVSLDENGYLYATLPANIDKKVPTIGFISHMDTSPDCSGTNIKAKIVANYDGKDIVLDPKDNIVLKTSMFPEILDYKGDDIIVTDGHTLLGADDKAGIVSIVEAMIYLMAHPEIKHGAIRVAFNPDEEIGVGAHKFDVEKFGCQWAYTMDGGAIGELEYENFNAAGATINIKGISVHPGSAKDKMINAIRLVGELLDIIPSEESPEHTEGYEGFYHVMNVKGNVEEATVKVIIRDHDRKLFEARKDFLKDTVNKMNNKYGVGTMQLEMNDQYYNMKEKIEPNMHIIDIAIKAMEKSNVKPLVQPIRGGTDGAQLSFKGLPCPNIFAGGFNFHGPYEYLPISSLKKAKEVVINICSLTAEF